MCNGSGNYLKFGRGWCHNIHARPASYEAEVRRRAVNTNCHFPDFRLRLIEGSFLHLICEVIANQAFVGTVLVFSAQWHFINQSDDTRTIK